MTAARRDRLPPPMAMTASTTTHGGDAGERPGRATLPPAPVVDASVLMRRSPRPAGGTGPGGARPGPRPPARRTGRDRRGRRSRRRTRSPRTARWRPRTAADRGAERVWRTSASSSPVVRPDQVADEASRRRARPPAPGTGRAGRRATGPSRSQRSTSAAQSTSTSPSVTHDAGPLRDRGRAPERAQPAAGPEDQEPDERTEPQQHQPADPHRQPAGAEPERLEQVGEPLGDPLDDPLDRRLALLPLVLGPLQDPVRGLAGLGRRVIGRWQVGQHAGPRQRPRHGPEDSQAARSNTRPAAISMSRPSERTRRSK